MGMQGIDRLYLASVHVELEWMLVNPLFNYLVAKLGKKAKDLVSPYFGMKDFAFAPAYA
jgi:hypothetical protein